MKNRPPLEVISVVVGELEHLLSQLATGAKCMEIYVAKALHAEIAVKILQEVICANQFPGAMYNG